MYQHRKMFTIQTKNKKLLNKYAMYDHIYGKKYVLTHNTSLKKEIKIILEDT